MEMMPVLVSVLGLLAACFRLTCAELVIIGSATDPFQESTDYIHALDEELFGSAINVEQLQLMIDVLMDRTACQESVSADTCRECITAEKIASKFGINVTNQNVEVLRDIEHFGQASVMLVYYLYDINVTCNSSSDELNATTYEDIVDAVCNLGSSDTSPVIGQPCDVFSIQQLNKIVEKLNETYRPTSYYECFTAESLFEDAGVPTRNADRAGMTVTFAYLIYHMLLGHCIGESQLVEPRFFIDDLYVTYGNTDGVMMMEDFMQLLHDIGLEEDHHESDVDENHESDVDENHESDVDENHESDVDENHESDVVLTTTPPNFTPSFEVTTPPMYNVTLTTSNTTNATMDYNSTLTVPTMTTPTVGNATNQTMAPRRFETKRKARSTEELNAERQRKKRDLSLEADFVGNECFRAEQLFDIFGVDPEVGLHREEFASLCPALIQQLSSKSCQSDGPRRGTTELSDVYLWGTLAVLIISLCSLLAILIIPCSGSALFNCLMHFLIALAIGTLSGDAFFHLLPEALGLHNHGIGSHSTSHVGYESFVFKLLATVASIYVCYLIEKLLKIYATQKDKQQKKGGHVNGLNGYDHAMNSSQNNENDNQSKSMDQLLMEPEEKKESSSCCQGFNSSTITILVGDSIHNFMDGLAIGAAFTADFNVGLSTTIAIVSHEIPHELGDFAVLIRNGMLKKKALFWNFISSLFAFIGLYVGINVASCEGYHDWVFAVTTGIFIHIALVDLSKTILEEPPHSFGKKQEEQSPLDEENYNDSTQQKSKEEGGCSCSIFILHNLGLLLGWAGMLLLALFEHRFIHLF